MIRCFKCKNLVRRENTVMALKKRYNRKSASYAPICKKCAKLDKLLKDKGIKVN